MKKPIISRTALKFLTAIALAMATLAMGSCDDGTVYTDAKLNESLADLDRMLADHDRNLEVRQMSIESLKRSAASDPNVTTLSDVADAYRFVNYDSIVAYTDRAIAMAKNTDPAAATILTARRAALAADDGIGATAEKFYLEAAAALDSLDDDQRIAYYEAGRDMYENLLFYAEGNHILTDSLTARAARNDARLMEALKVRKSSPLYRLERGRLLVLKGRNDLAETILRDVFDSEPINDDLFIRASMLLALIEFQKGDRQAYMYYLSEAAIGSASRGDVYLPGIDRLGKAIYEDNNTDKASQLLKKAMSGALYSNSRTEILRASKSLPNLNEGQESAKSTLITTLIVLIILLATVGAVAAFFLVKWDRARRRRRAEEALRADEGLDRELYFNRFVELCLEYKDRLETFTQFVNRKISSGKADEVVRYIRNGKLANEQTAEFFRIIDRSFLKMYPDFVAQVNKLLLPDQQIEPREGELLNTDLRILAFMRMGIDDTGRIAQMLGYSVNTIYAYRTRLRQRAINKDTFEQDVRRISSAG